MDVYKNLKFNFCKYSDYGLIYYFTKFQMKIHI
jgi:hypothetical protein